MKKLVSFICALLLTYTTSYSFEDTLYAAKQLLIRVVVVCADNQYPTQSYCLQKTRLVKNELVKLAQSELEEKMIDDINKIVELCYNVCMEPHTSDDIMKKIIRWRGNK